MAQLTRTLTLYSGADASPVLDYTNDTDWTQVELASTGNLGEASAGQWLVRDEGGLLPDYVPPTRFIAGHNVVVVTVGSNTLFRGRVAAQEQFRGRQKAGRANEITVTLEDQNSHLRGIAVHNWVRPAETDVDRALALDADYLSGSPRATTNLATNLIITGSNLISLPAKTYSGVTPFEIMQELASNADKEMFVTVDNELAYFGHDYTGYNSLLRISDDPADQNATTYAPWDPRSNWVGRENLTRLRTYYGSDVVQSSLQVGNSYFDTFYDYWEDIYWDSESVTADQAIARASKMLSYRSQDDVSLSCTIGPMDGNEIWKIKPGQLIQFKARAARSGRLANGTYIGDSFFTTRVREIRWITPAEDIYIARLELERPKHGQFAGRGSKALATAVQLCHGTESCCTDDFERVTATDWGTSPIKCLEWQTHAGFLPDNEATNSYVNGSAGVQVSDGTFVHDDWLELGGWDGTPAQFLVKTRFDEAVWFQIEKSGIEVDDGGIGTDGYTKFRWGLGIDGLGEVFASLIATDVSGIGVSLGAFSVETGATGLWLWARCHLEDQAIRMNVWKDGDSEPAGWNAEIAYSGGPVPSFLGATTGIPLCDLFQVITSDGLGAGIAGTVEVESIEIVSGIDCGGFCDVCGMSGGTARTPGTSTEAAPIDHDHDSVDNGAIAGGDLSGTYPNPTVPHITDTSAAHAASSLSFTPAGTIAATNVQAAIEEVASEAGAGGSGPFIDNGGGQWMFDFGYSQLFDDDNIAYLLLNGYVELFSEADANILLTVNESDPGGPAKHLLTGGSGLVIPILSADPGGGDSEAGQVYYDSGTDKFRAYENGAWVDMIGGGSSHTHVYSEVPSGTVNGSNDTFTLVATPAAGTLRLYKNGLRQKAGAGNDYTLATATITFLTGNIPQTGDNLLADYE